jgi:hypothetical protein
MPVHRIGYLLRGGADRVEFRCGLHDDFDPLEC